MINTAGVVVAVVLLLGAVPGSSAIAGPSWICAITDAVECNEDGTIGPPDLGGLARPTFLRVDVDRKEVTLLAPPERSGEITKIDLLLDGEGIWVFSGVEAGRAWSMVISEGGHMTLSVTGDGATWSVFGSAMLEQ
jgi:hypothetical protein